MESLGGENSKDTLLNVLKTDDDPVVLAEAAYALGTIGIDEEGEVSRAIAFALQNQDQMVPNDNFAHASLLAIQKLIEKNGSTNNNRPGLCCGSSDSSERELHPSGQGKSIPGNLSHAGAELNILRYRQKKRLLSAAVFCSYLISLLTFFRQSSFSSFSSS